MTELVAERLHGSNVLRMPLQLGGKLFDVEQRVGSHKSNRQRGLARLRGREFVVRAVVQ
jgi:hypothetical protein